MKLKYRIPHSFEHLMPIIFRCTLIIVSLIIILSVLSGVVSASSPNWWNYSKQYVVHMQIPDGARPAVFTFNLSNTTGVNDKTHIYGNGHFNKYFSGINFTLGNTTKIPYWFNTSQKTLSSVEFYVNVTENSSSLDIYYGDGNIGTEISNESNGDATFTFYGDSLSDFTVTGSVSLVGNEFIITGDGGWAGGGIVGKTAIARPSVLEWDERLGVTGSEYQTGYAPSLTVSTGAGFYGYYATDTVYTYITSTSVSIGLTQSTTPMFYRMIISPTTGYRFFRNGIEYINSETSTATNWYPMFQIFDVRPLNIRNNVRAYKYYATQPELSTWGAEISAVLQPPLFVNPLQNSVTESITINSSWERSIDITNDSSIIWYNVQFSNDSTFATNISQNTTINLNYSLNLSTGANFARIRAFTNNLNSSWSSTTTFFMGSSTLYTPPNNSVFNIVFPTLTDNIDFLWSLPSGYASNLQVARDIDFNTIVYDGVLANNTHTLYLGSGIYKWRVRFYNIGTQQYYSFGNVFNFSVVSQSPNLDSTSIYGVVYKLVDGVQTPISNAEVRLWNNYSTVSYSTITGSNGYFVFSSLQTNSTFFIQAKKSDEYDDSSIEIVTTGNNTKTEKNILMVGCTIAYNCFVNQKSVSFTVRWLYCITNCNIPGVLISIYDGNNVLASYSGTTDSTGTYKTTVLKDKLYRLTAINSTLGISKEMTFYPDDEKYIITISNTNTETGTKYPIQEKDGVKIDITKNQVNNVSATITVNYTDYLASTTGLIVYLNRTNLSNPYVPIIVDSFISGSGNQSHTFNINNYSSDYFIHIMAIHGVYGTIDRTYAITFLRNLISVDGISSNIWMWFGIVVMFFTGAIFSKSTSEFGLIIVCAEGWIFLAAGVFSYLDLIQNVGQLKFGIGLTVATILAFISYFKKSNQGAGYT